MMNEEISEKDRGCGVWSQDKHCWHNITYSHILKYWDCDTSRGFKNNHKWSFISGVLGEQKEVVRSQVDTGKFIVSTFSGLICWFGWKNAEGFLFRKGFTYRVLLPFPFFKLEDWCFFFFATSSACKSSQARNWTWATAVKMLNLWLLGHKGTLEDWCAHAHTHT